MPERNGNVPCLPRTHPLISIKSSPDDGGISQRCVRTFSFVGKDYCGYTIV